MPRTDTIRADLQRFVRRVPFEKFVLMLENGDRVVIEHPENIAFDPEPGGAEYFHALSGKIRLDSTFHAITGFARTDRGDAAA